MSSGSSSSSSTEEWVATETCVVVVGVVGAFVGSVVVIVGEGSVSMRACRRAARLVGSVFPSMVVRTVGSLPKRVVKRAERSGRVGGESGMLGWAGWWGEEGVGELGVTWEVWWGEEGVGELGVTWEVCADGVGADGADGGGGVGDGGG